VVERKQRVVYCYETVNETQRITVNHIIHYARKCFVN